jgi:RTX calcium-binding nonapeptide repeat (4 copies)
MRAPRIATAAVLAIAAIALMPGAAAGGDACTITGTSDGEIIRGTAGPDVICGRGGHDFILGRAVTT